MKMITLSVILIATSALFFTGCSSKNSDTSKDNIESKEISPVAKNETSKPMNTKELDKGNDSLPVNSSIRISSTEAKDMMDQKEDIIILDVRTEAEYKEGYINGAILIPDYELAEKAEIVLEDKSATILLYCRSGRRSAIAASTLNKLGYENVYDFGGILDWEYETVTD